MLFMASYLSGIVAVILGEQGLMEFLFVFLFILIGTAIMVFVDKKVNQETMVMEWGLSRAFF